MLATTAACIVGPMKTIGSRIAAAREAKGLNQSELARRLSISPQSVQAWEADRNTPRPKRLGEIASALGVSMASLMGEPDAAESQPALGGSPAPNSGAADKVRQMLEKVGKGLPAEARQQIIRAAAEGSEQPGSNVISADFSGLRLKDGDISIPQYDIRGAMGHGQVPADYAEAVRNVVLSATVLREKGVEYSAPANLAIITGWGQSMEGTINDKDPVIVDRGITEFAGDGVYVLTWHDHLYIKRLQVFDAEHYELISDNPKHKDRVVPTGEVTIHAKVLLVWNAQKL